MFCWLVMPLPRLVSNARLVLCSLVLLDWFASQVIRQGGEEAADFISLRSAHWRALLYTQLSTEGEAMLLTEECHASAAQPVPARPEISSPALHSCWNSCSTLKPPQQPPVHTQAPALLCSAADVGFSRLLSNTHLSMQSGAAGTYAYAGESGPHRGPRWGLGAPVPAFFFLVVAIWLACRICVSPASSEQLLMLARIGGC